jgi:hypothetical protein
LRSCKTHNSLIRVGEQLRAATDMKEAEIQLTFIAQSR